MTVYKSKDPLVLAYETLRNALHPLGVGVYDDLPDAGSVRKELPAANVSCVASSVEKAFMREFEPHHIIVRNDGMFDVITETARFNYVFDVSFFAGKRGAALWLATRFMTKVELCDTFEVEAAAIDSLNQSGYLGGDETEDGAKDGFVESVQVLLKSPPSPPVGEPDLYMSALSLNVRGKLLTKEVVPEFDINRFKIKAVSM